MYPQVLFRNRKAKRIATLDEYCGGGGYQALGDVLAKYAPKEVCALVEKANLRGRGGAGFPAAKKWEAVPEDGAFPRYLVANSDEMEPGTFKDRVLIHADPHTIIEGVAIAAYAISASKAFIFVRPDYESSAWILENEIEKAKQAGYLGKNILGSGYSLEVIVHRSGGRYICGEGTALLNALMGKRANPKKPPPYPTVEGLWGRPTVVNNIETLANVPHIVRNGPEWFNELSMVEKSGGTKIFSVSGRVKNPGCFELPMGVPLREIIEEHAGGMLPGLEFKTCLPGGASTRFLTPDLLDVRMDFDSMAEVGHRMGTGAIIVFDRKTCLVGATLNLTQFFMRESCGWCTPCREGLPYLKDLLWRIENGEGKEEYIPMIQSMCKHLWNSYCALAPGAASPIESLLTFFEDEVREHIVQKGCPFK
ncbi:complex I 51 kDa subunit family protein [Desulforhabdus amnigena]|nr:NADH-ubiquinone oxidoreductase-F iron-sulfur binding region domain-containing protein [Desulforhabdus amnigena]NLJ27158.1 NADH-quinone oxidoreductase subunit F [Deltaproteobacteria bacterium]